MKSEILCNRCGADIVDQVRAEISADRTAIGTKGGLARSAGLTPTQRAIAARRAADARWSAVRLKADSTIGASFVR